MNKGKIEINIEMCKGCGYCIQVCPKKILDLSEQINSRGLHFATVTREEECIGCAMCGRMCPDAAITVYRG